MAQEILGSGIFEIGFRGNANDVNKFRDSIKQLSSPASQVASSFKNVNTGVQNFNVNIRQAGQATQGFSASLGNFSKEMFFTATAIGAVNVALLALNRSVAETAFGFDRNMTMIKAVTNASASEFEKLGEIARDMGQQTEFGATQAAEGLLVLARMGLSVSESMEVLEPAMKLAQSQQYSMAESTELVISQLRVFGESVEASSKFANVLAATSSKSAADLEKLNLSLSYVGPVANAAGRSFEEVNATLGLMFNAGIRASRAGTSLRFAFANLMNPTKRVEKTIKALGLTVDSLNPNVNSMNDIFVTLAKRLEGVQNKAAIMFELFGKRAAPAMTAVVNEVTRNNDAFQDMQDSITGTNEVQRQFEEQTKSFSGSVKLLSSSWEEVSLQLGDTLLPTMRLVIDSLQNLSEWFKNSGESNKTAIGFLIQTATVATTLAAAFASTAWVVGTIAKAMKGLAVTSGALGAALKGNIATARANKIATQEQLIATTALDAALQKSIRTDLRKQMSKIGIAKSSAKLIASTMAETVATKASGKEKLTAAMSTIKLTAAQYGLTAAEQKQLVATIQNVSGQKSFKAALDASSVSAKGLGTSLKGLTAALGGPIGIITTLATIALPALISSVVKLKAEDEEARRLTLQRVEALNSLKKGLDSVRDSIKSLESDQKNANKSAAEQEAIAKRLANLNVKEADNIREIVKLMPEWIQGYDKVTGQFELNEEAMRKYLVKNQELLKVEEKAAKQNFSSREEELKFYEKELENIREKISLTSETLQQDKEAIGNTKRRLEAERKMAQTLSTIVTPEGEDPSSEAMIQAQEDLSKYNDKIDETGGKLRKLIDAHQSLSEKIERLGGVADSTGDEVINLGQDGSDSADKFSDSLDKLILNLEKLRQKLLDIENQRKREIDVLNTASQFDREMLKITNAGLKEKEGLLASVQEKEKELAALKKEQAQGDNLVSEEDMAKAEKALKSVQDQYTKTARVITEKSKIMGGQLKEKTLKAMKDSTNGIINATEEMQRKIEEFAGLNYSTMVERVQSEKQLKIDAINEEIEGIKKGLSKDESIRKEQIKKIEALEKQKKKIAEDTQQEIYEVALEYEKKRAELELIRLRNMGAGDDTLTQLKIKQLKEYLEKLEAAGKTETDIYAKTKAEMQDIEDSFLDKTLDKWEEWGGVVRSIVKSIAPEFEYLIDILEDTIDLVKGIVSENYAEAAASLVGIVTTIVSKVKQNREDAEKRRIEQIEKLAKYETELVQSTLDLRDAFVTVARDVLSISGSQEGATMNWEDAAEGIIKAASTANEQPVDTTINAVEEMFKLIPKDIAMEIMKGGEAGDKALKDWLQKYFPSDKSIYAGATLIGTKDIQQKSIKDETGINNAQMEALWQTFIESGMVQSNRSGSRATFDYNLDPQFLTAMGTAMTSFYTNRLREQALGGIIDPDSATMSFDELTGTIADSVSKLQEIAVQTDGKGKSPVVTEDFISMVERLFERRMASAENEEDIAKAFSDRFSQLAFVKRTEALWSQLSTTRQIDLQDEFLNMDKNQKDFNKALSDFREGNLATEDNEELKEYAGELQSAAGDIAAAFDSGALTYKEAVSALDKIEANLSKVPKQMRTAIEDSIRSARIDVLSGEQDKKTAGEESLEKVNNLTEEYLSNIDRVKEETDDIINSWYDLIAEKDNITNQFIKESQQLSKESDKRISELESERSAILGTFDFSQTQSIRSNLFQKVSEADKKISDERKSAARELLELETEYEEKIIEITEKMSEWTSEYGSIQKVYETAAERRNAIESEFVTILNEEIDKMRELFGVTMDVMGALSTASGDTAASIIQSGIDSLGDTSDLAKLEEERKQSQKDKVTSSVQDAGSFSVNSDLGTLQPEDFTKLGQQELIDRVKSEWQKVADLIAYNAKQTEEYDKKIKEINKSYKDGLIDINTMLEQKRQAGIDRDYKDIIPQQDIVQQFKDLYTYTYGQWDDSLLASGPKSMVQTSNQNAGGYSIPSAAGLDWGQTASKQITDATKDPFSNAFFGIDPIFAQHGFQGIVKKPTMFMTGENNKPEFVNVTPLSGLSDYEGGMAGGGQTVIQITENIDLRGAYGISSPQVAEKVWKDVWAPARRRTTNRLLDMRGKVQR
jgi:TP901 family phage tail tape measure protein